MTRIVTTVGVGLLALLSAACLVEGDPLGGPHGGVGGYVPPGGGEDAGWPEPDGGLVDSAPPEDSALPDTGTPDTGTPDTGPIDAGHDSATDAPVDTAPPDTGPPPPTWSDIFDKYVKSGTVGGCGGCHGLSTAKEAYSWFSGNGQIKGTSSPIVIQGQSMFSWFGGFMPPAGPSSEPQAASDMKAWVAAGALDN